MDRRLYIQIIEHQKELAAKYNELKEKMSKLKTKKERERFWVMNGGPYPE